MVKFICPKGHGRTGFVNMAEMYKKFKPDIPFEYVFVRLESEVKELKEQMALGRRKFDIRSKPNTEETTVDNIPVSRWTPNEGYHPPIINSVSPHPITGESVLRYIVDSHAIWMPISDVDTEKEKISFDFDLIKEIRNPDNQFWWDWTEGDFLLADLFCMMHSVMGGFTPEQRVLDVVFSNKVLPL
jgi:alpha-ketoglutarate-dependent taurine dioxygenase